MAGTGKKLRFLVLLDVYERTVQPAIPIRFLTTFTATLFIKFIPKRFVTDPKRLQDSDSSEVLSSAATSLSQRQPRFFFRSTSTLTTTLLTTTTPACYSAVSLTTPCVRRRRRRTAAAHHISQLPIEGRGAEMGRIR
jgi:hypothetical protein